MSMKRVAMVAGLCMICMMFCAGISNADNSLTSLVGDNDSFGTGVAENALVNVYNIANTPADGDFDLWALNSFNWSHTFTLPAGAYVTGATLTIVTFDVEDNGAGDGKGGVPYDDKLFIDGVEVPGAFDDTDTPDMNVPPYQIPLPRNTNTFTLDSSFFPYLQDGSISVKVDPLGGTLKDSIAIDYALLELVISDIAVSIDIKPGSDPNSINLGSNGTVPVAILSSDTFDATTVNPSTITLAGATVALKGKAETPMASSQDVNGDGLLDLVVHVTTDALVLTDGDTIAILVGTTYDGWNIIGQDTVRIVP